MRKVPTSQYGYVSPIATSDGSYIGMTKHMLPDTEFSHRPCLDAAKEVRLVVAEHVRRWMGATGKNSDVVTVLFYFNFAYEGSVPGDDRLVTSLCASFPYVYVHYEPRVALYCSTADGTMYNAKRVAPSHIRISAYADTDTDLLCERSAHRQLRMSMTSTTEAIKHPLLHFLDSGHGDTTATMSLTTKIFTVQPGTDDAYFSNAEGPRLSRRWNPPWFDTGLVASRDGGGRWQFDLLGRQNEW
ncbi:hypothetical protein HPB49_025915 [Dermacentor silvarum]|nr:hypothetical protein HPB49_025915 [Dermacentor silvarum]